MRYFILSLIFILTFSFVALATAITQVIYVKKGDTLYSLSRQYGVSVSQLKARNRLRTHVIQPGQKLIIKRSAAKKAATPLKAGKIKKKPAKPTKLTAKKPKPKVRYTVKKGDTLKRISISYSVSIKRLKEINKIKNNALYVGQVIKVRGNNYIPKPKKPAPKLYIVRKGDTLHNLAKRHGVSVWALKSFNRMKNTTIHVGHQLRIPSKGAVASLPPHTEVRVIYRYIRVAKGQNGYTLAKKYKLKPNDLRRLNKLGSIRYVVPGMKLLVPQRIPVPIPPKPRAPAIAYRHARPLGIPVKVVKVDLRHRNVLVSPVLPRNGWGYGRGARVSTLARFSGANAVVNGGYFHPHSYAPAGDIVMNGQLLSWGRIPAALAITPDNRATIRSSALNLRPTDKTWRGMETVIATGPRILAHGRLQYKYSRSFRDPALFRRAARSAIGLASNRDLIMVTTRTKLTITEMAKVMANLGARDALLLDGGSSAGLVYKGTTMVDSGRKVSFGVGVFTNYTGRRYAR